jgi:hypothetical protein
LKVNPIKLNHTWKGHQTKPQHSGRNFEIELQGSHECEKPSISLFQSGRIAKNPNHEVEENL